MLPTVTNQKTRHFGYVIIPLLQGEQVLVPTLLLPAVKSTHNSQKTYIKVTPYTCLKVAQSVQRLTTGWVVRGSNPGGGETFRTRPDRPWDHPASCTMGTGWFPEVNSGRGVTLTPHPLLVPWSRKSRAIPLLALCAVRPVQSLSACTMVHFILPYTGLKSN